MRKLLLTAFFLLAILPRLFAVGEASTYFQTFVPPNNDPVGRDVCLIVTAVYDSTSFEIIDDDMDGDSDDSVSGMLMEGQSYVLYIRDGGVNDDAPHRGESATKQDGDYFIIKSDKLIFTSQSTNSDWQHDWVPATNKTSKGKRFVIFAPPTSFSNRDLNVYPYQDETTVTVRRISTAKQTVTGYTNVDVVGGEIVIQKELNIGEDIIFNNTEGRDILFPGETYLVESNKDITLQYGALWMNSRDGGGFVPSDNGSSTGNLFYFTVHFQASNEQEIRIVSWENDNDIELSYFEDGSWRDVKTFNLDNYETADWVSTSGNKEAVFRIKSTKNVSVFEANWLETGSPGTSDIASMVSSGEGNTSGQKFIVYMSPPGREVNVTDPFTGLKMGTATHLYIFARNGANVTVKDIGTDGETISRTYRIEAERYVDCALNLEEWKSIYNGDGVASSGPERPYLVVESDEPVSVFHTNFNDNWMTYFGTSQTQDFKLESSENKVISAPGDEVVVSAKVVIEGDALLANPIAVTYIGDGATLIESNIANTTTNDTITGTGTVNETTGKTEVKYEDFTAINASEAYEINTTVVLNPTYNDGTPVPDQAIIPIETTLSGEVDGEIQQAASSSGVVNNSNDLSRLLYSRQDLASLTKGAADHWSIAIMDINHDGYDDVFLTSYEQSQSNILLLNDQSGSFTNASLSPTLQMAGTGSVAQAWADFDNDGNTDLLIGTNGTPDRLFRNENGSLVDATGLLPDLKTYAHGTSWIDVNNDGLLDIFIADYFPTGFNQLYLNQGKDGFIPAKTSVLTGEASYSIGATWADIDGDGDLDLFVPNDKESANSLYRNLGNGNFEKVQNDLFDDDSNSSTGSFWADYDNDLDMDLFVTNAGKQNNVMYENTGDGTFVKRTDLPMSQDGGDSHGAAWGDVDNDGDVDLFVANDQSGLKFFYKNNGDGTFVRVINEAINAAIGNTMAAAFSDTNNDGDLDLVVASHSGSENYYFTNNGNGNNWLKVLLQGTVSNSSAIGAKIQVFGVGDVAQQQREVASPSGGGAGSQSSFTAHFGLANATRVDSVVVYWPSGIRQVLSDLDANQLVNIEEPAGTLVEGIVYHDVNQNGVQDETELGIADRVITVDQLNISAVSNGQGAYSLTLAPGNYTLTQVEYEPWRQSQPAGNESIAITVESYQDTLTGNNFGNVGMYSKPDLSVEIFNTVFRRGFENEMGIVISNLGDAAASGVELTLGATPGLYLNSSVPVSETALDNEMTWKVGIIPAGESIEIMVIDSVGLEIFVGDPVDVTASVTLQDEDADVTNNEVIINSEVVGAIDPNDIAVSPEGLIRAGERLTYTIRFQNVGTYMASHVVVVDTLSQYLNTESYQLVSVSHEGTFKMEDNVLTWNFRHINLPDSISNEPESHGFIVFSMKVNDDAPYGEEVVNEANIRFDYENFLKTNAVFNTLVDENSRRSSKEALKLFPNPFRNEAEIRIPYDENGPVTISSVKIFSLTGQLLMLEENVNAKFLSLRNLNLRPGYYMVEATDQLGTRYHVKALKR